MQSLQGLQGLQSLQGIPTDCFEPLYTQEELLSWMAPASDTHCFTEHHARPSKPEHHQTSTAHSSPDEAHSAAPPITRVPAALLCVSCEEAKRDCILPCSHYSMCTSCAKAMHPKKCMHCHASFTTKQLRRVIAV